MNFYKSELAKRHLECTPQRQRPVQTSRLRPRHSTSRQKVSEREFGLPFFWRSFLWVCDLAQIFVGCGLIQKMAQLRTLLQSNSVSALDFELDFLVHALEQVYRTRDAIAAADILKFGRQVSAATRHSAWASAMHLSLKEMHAFACSRAERYVNPLLLPLWIIDLIRLRLTAG